MLNLMGCSVTETCKAAPANKPAETTLKIYNFYYLSINFIILVLLNFNIVYIYSQDLNHNQACKQ